MSEFARRNSARILAISCVVILIIFVNHIRNRRNTIGETIVQNSFNTPAEKIVPDRFRLNFIPKKYQKWNRRNTNGETIVQTSFNTSAEKIVPDRFRLNFIPEKYQKCEDLIQNSSTYGIQFSPMNRLKSKEFEEAVRFAIVGGGGVEGHSGQVNGQYLVMHHLASHSAAKVICETGFNLGHSSFNFLTANEKAIVHSFDLGNHGYAHEMSDYLKKLFPARFSIHFGDSRKTIPQFIRTNPELQCDMIFVDGGHVFPVALADIKNFARMANLEENIIVFDDYPTDWGKSFGKAWDDSIKEGILKESMRCTFQYPTDLQRGFTIGRVLKKPM